MSVFQGDLVLGGNNVTIIQDEEFRINGSIIVEENATLLLKNALLNFTQSRDYEFELRLQNPSGGGPRLLVEYASILGNGHYLESDLYASSSGSVSMLSAPNLYLYSRGSSALSVSDSSIRHLGCLDRSVVYVSNSSLRGAEVRAYSVCEMVGCTIQRLQAYSSERMDVVGSAITSHLSILTVGANLSADGLLPGFFSSWSFREDCSVLIAPGGSATNLSLTDTQVDDWILEAYSASNATVSNSDLRTVFLDDTAQLWLENTTLQAYSIEDRAQAVVGWFLEVHVVDSAGQDVPSADVEASYPDGGRAQSRVTGPDGWTRLTLTEKLLNATGEYPAGIYTVRAAYGGHSATTTVNMTWSRRIEMGLPDFEVPESGSSPLLALILALLAAVALLARRSPGSSETWA